MKSRSQIKSKVDDTPSLPITLELIVSFKANFISHKLISHNMYNPTS